jgi:hypothetical protein
LGLLTDSAADLALELAPDLASDQAAVTPAPHRAAAVVRCWWVTLDWSGLPDSVARRQKTGRGEFRAVQSLALSVGWACWVEWMLRRALCLSSRVVVCLRLMAREFPA